MSRSRLSLFFAITLTNESLSPLRLELTSRGFIHEDDEKKSPPQ